MRGLGTERLLRWTRLLAAMVVVAVGVAIPTPASAAYECRTNVVGRTIKDSVVEPARADCRLHTSVVRGGATVEPGATFSTYFSEIPGSFTAIDHEVMIIETGEVRGVFASGGTHLTNVTDSEIRGDVTFTGSSGLHVIIADSTIRGSATVSDNHVQVVVWVFGTSIEVHLACSGYSPVTSNLGWPNAVAGPKTGECAGLCLPRVAGRGLSLYGPRPTVTVLAVLNVADGMSWVLVETVDAQLAWVVWGLHPPTVEVDERVMRRIRL